MGTPRSRSENAVQIVNLKAMSCAINTNNHDFKKYILITYTNELKLTKHIIKKVIKIASKLQKGYYVRKLHCTKCRVKVKV